MSTGWEAAGWGGAQWWVLVLSWLLAPGRVVLAPSVPHRAADATGRQLLSSALRRRSQCAWELGHFRKDKIKKWVLFMVH